MSEIAAVHNTGLAEAGDVLRRIGVGVFAFAMVALGVETLICARDVAQVLGPQYVVARERNREVRRLYTRLKTKSDCTQLG
jgi:hypothetical protein